MPDLRNGKFQGADAGLERAGLEAVGVAIALDATLIWGGSDVGFAFESHGCVHEKFGDSGEGVLKAVVAKEIDEWILGGNLFVFVHGWCCFWI